MAKRDYYEVLGVSKDTAQADLKKAYRRKAMKFHPDRNPGDKEAEAKFKEAKEAYEVLADPNKRSAYDQFGHAGVESGIGGSGGFSGDANGFGDIFGDIFSDIFGAGGPGGAQKGQRRRQARGADIGYKLELSLEDAIKGKQVEIQVPTSKTCDICNGSGAKKGTKPVSCQACDGRGQVRMQQGFFSIQQTCPNCHGSGEVISDPCNACRGEGRVKHSKTLSVKVPAGVDTGDQIRLSGEGDIGHQGAEPGDLYVQVDVKSHPIFKREGDDLTCAMPISFAQAVLGGDIEIPTLDGRLNLKIPSETQSGKLFRMRGKGVRNVRTHHTGDLYCKIMIETPVNLTVEQKDILKNFDESIHAGGKKHNPKEGGWKDKIKSFLDDLVT